MTIAWVLGSSGLLGAALCRQLRRNGTTLFFPADRLAWNNSGEFAAQLATAVRAFADEAAAADRWEIYWAAGIGTMASSPETLAPETRALSLLLQRLESESRFKAVPGSVALASTAGAIYAGSADEIITENTAPAPTTAYAHAKLEQEALLRCFADSHDHASVLIARISTLYGPGQAAGKKQGLMTYLARSILRNHPVQIYVPYDTIRDYITTDDAAAAMVAAARDTGGGAERDSAGNTVHETSGTPRAVTKIIASERPATIAEIVSIFRRLARRAPRIATSANRLSAVYARRVQFRSIVSVGPVATPTTTLAIGIAQLMAAERVALMHSTGAEAS